MKKLFLYISLYGAVFLIAFLSSMLIYKHNSKPYEEDTTQKSGIENIARLTDSKKGTDDEVFSDNQKNKYIIGPKNGNIIVYLNTLENVYDYTGINLNNVKLNDEDTYNRILNYIVIYDKEELYKFLEAISN